MANVYDVNPPADPRVYNDRPNGVASITGILLHHTGSTNEQGDINWLSRYHTNPVSTNKLFKRNGDIIKIVPDAKRAWHAGSSRWAGVDDCNNFTIGYEICNNGVGEAYTEAQYRSLAESIAYDCAVYRIRDCDVTTHKLVRQLWNGKYPNQQAEAKTDPFGLNMTRLWIGVWDVRANWPANWPPFWHWWLNMSGQPR